MKIGFIGGGQMCEAIVRGIIKSSSDANISISEPFESRREYLCKAYPQIHVTSSNDDIIAKCDVVIISVKPQQLATAFGPLSPNHGTLYISICAGIPLQKLAETISRGARIARVMPNLPAMLGEGASGFCVNSKCSPSDVETVKKICIAMGAVAEQIPESLMDALTSVSGSGPAYVCLMIEAMADAGVREGLPRDVALRLAAQTCVGAGKMVLQGGDSNHPAVLKDKVCSPGGTTIVGVSALEDKGFRAAVMAAVGAVAQRSRELGKL